MSTGETTSAQQLIGLLNEGMLVLADHGFDSNTFLQALAGAQAQFLVVLSWACRVAEQAGTFRHDDPGQE
jgi:hypothetical protein